MCKLKPFVNMSPNEMIVIGEDEADEQVKEMTV